MERQQIAQRVREYYWRENLNCATTTLRICAEHCDVAVSQQVLDAAVGMHGAGGCGAQCGLVEGTLMFLGILGRARGLPDTDIVQLCCRYGEEFEKTYTSLLCRELRPEGFADDQPPHLCEGLTCRSISFSIDFVDRYLPAGGDNRAAEEDRATIASTTATTGQ